MDSDLAAQREGLRHCAAARRKQIPLSYGEIPRKSGAALQQPEMADRKKVSKAIVSQNVYTVLRLPLSLQADESTVKEQAPPGGDVGKAGCGQIGHRNLIGSQCNPLQPHDAIAPPNRPVLSHVILAL